MRRGEDKWDREQDSSKEAFTKMSVGPAESQKPSTFAKSYQLLPSPIHARFRPDNPRFVPHIQQPSHGFAAVRTVIECALVHVHADKLVSLFRVEIAGKLHCVSQRFFAMIESILNTLAQPH